MTIISELQQDLDMMGHDLQKIEDYARSIVDGIPRNTDPIVSCMSADPDVDPEATMLMRIEHEFLNPLVPGFEEITSPDWLMKLVPLVPQSPRCVGFVTTKLWERHHQVAR